MKITRALPRVALLMLAAAAFAGLTGIYGGSVRPPLPSPQWRHARWRRPSTPNAAQFPELIAEVLIVVIYAVAGRIVLRLRLSPASRGEGQPILLGLDRGNRTSQIKLDSAESPQHSPMGHGL